jgi:MraZ protein
MGTHLNKLDAKKRVSIPAQFRAVLRGGGEGGAALVLRPSHQHPCIEGWPQAVFDELARPVERLDLFSGEHDDIAAALYADACPVESDKEGRIVLPDTLVAHAALTDTVGFFGFGRYFQIWEPEAGARRIRAARDSARTRTLPRGTA